MASRGNQPLLAVAMAPYAAVATAGQSYFPIPGGVVPGLNIVAVGGALLSPGDFDDSDGLGINLAVGVAAGTQFQLYAMGYNTSYVPVGGQLAPYRNKLINGNFDVWQRGTAIGAAAGVVFGADRWHIESSLDGGSYLSGAGFGRNNFTLGQTAVPGNPAYYATIKASITGGGNSAYWVVGQKIEGVRTFAGDKATFSVWLDCSVARTAKLQFVQQFGTGGSPSASVRFGTQDLVLNGGNGTQWKQYRITVDVPSIAGKTLGSNGDDCLIAYLWMQAGATVGAAVGVGTITDPSPGSTLYMARAQFEAGSVATDFEGRHIQQELALCRRYYRRVLGATGLFNSATSATLGISLSDNPMRVAPTASYSGTGQLLDSGIAFRDITGIAVVNVAAHGGYVDLNTTGATAGKVCILAAGSSGYLDLSAEL